MSKIIWKGSLSFGLVSIPINLYSAIETKSIGFQMLHNFCHTPIKYQRWCPHCKKEVGWESIVKGIEMPNGNYFILTQDALKKLKPEKTDLITVIEFVDQDSVNPIYYSNHYYITPGTGHNDKAFFLFLVALSHLKKVAIGTFVMRDKEYVCTIQPYQSVLLLSTLNYDYEIRSVQALKAEKVPKAAEKELVLAQELIKRLYRKTFSIKDFKDTFFEKVEKKLKEQEKKGKGKKKKIEAPQTKGSKKIAAEHPTLMHALQQSLKTKSARKRR